MNKNKCGRPVGYRKINPKTKMLMIRLTEKEYELLHKESIRNNKSMSQIVRDKLYKSKILEIVEWK